MRGRDVAIALHGWIDDEPVSCDGFACGHGAGPGYRLAEVVAVDPGLEVVVEYSDDASWATVPLELIRGAWILGS